MAGSVIVEKTPETLQFWLDWLLREAKTLSPSLSSFDSPSSYNTNRIGSGCGVSESEANTSGGSVLI